MQLYFRQFKQPFPLLSKVRIALTPRKVEYKGKMYQLAEVQELINGLDRPQEPHPDQCCDSGCNPCVYDSYERNLQFYFEDLEALQTLVKQF